jgi:23S rRNA-/tRNA-specific pseudouridylate synthase
MKEKHKKSNILLDHPSGLIALYKPEGILSHPNNAKGSPDALLTAPYDLKTEAYTTAEGPLYLLHRLDSPTSGIVLLSRSLTLAQNLRQQFKEGQIQKTYYAIVVHPILKARHGIWKDKLLTLQKDGQLRTVVDPHRGHLAETHFQLMQHEPQRKLGLLKLLPKTGRTHQLRIQASHHGCPILGDKTYGNFERNRFFEKSLGIKRLCLHAGEVVLMGIDRQPIHVQCPIPDEFLNCLSLDKT